MAQSSSDNKATHIVTSGFVNDIMFPNNRSNACYTDTDNN